MNVALELPSGLVRRGHDALAGGLELVEPGQELVRQPDVAEDQSRPSGEVLREVLLGRLEAVARRLRERERTQELASMVDEEGRLCLREGGPAFMVERSGPFAAVVLGP